MRIGFIVLSWICAATAFGQDGLIGHWSFDGNSQGRAMDSSPTKLHGRVTGARRIERGDGLALQLSGRNQHVEIPRIEQMGIGNQVTVSVWVNVLARPGNEPAIVVLNSIEKGCGLTYYKDGKVYWYVAGGGNNIKAPMSTGAWHHLVGTYDGSTSQLYMDGVPVGRKTISAHLDVSGTALFGKRDVAEYFLAGLLDEVSIYSRALSADEVAALHKEQAGQMTASMPLIRGGMTIAGDRWTVRVGTKGGVQVDIGDETYFLESLFSYPAASIGHNRLSQLSSPDDSWRVNVARNGDAITVDAVGRHYRLQRTITRQGHRVVFADTLTNTAGKDVGVIVQYAMSSAGESEPPVLCGTPTTGADRAENPTVLLQQKASALGAVAEDSLFRVQFEATAQLNQALFGVRHFALQPGASHTFEFALYPFAGDADYWTFINQVRRDWDVNFTLPGPQDMFNVSRQPHLTNFSDPQKLREYLEYNQLKVMLLAPWLDYDNVDSRTGKLTTREVYRELMQMAHRNVRAVDPDAMVLGDIEAPFVSFPEDVVQQMLEVMDQPKQGYHEMTDAMMQVFRANPVVWNRWGDSIVWTKNKKAQYEYYWRQRPMMALTVRPQMGNGQHKFLLNQIQFIIDDVGLDGYYIDSWTGAKHRHYGYSYDKWDGVTVDIDPATGQITNRYTDLALAGTTSRAALISYGLDRGKYVVVNGHPITRESQSLRHMAFNESEWVFEPLQWPDGQMPPREGRPRQAHLHTPIALGFRPHRAGDESAANYAKIIIKCAIAYLRNGVLYFHYGTEMPVAGQPGSGEYGPFNHMYPITPVQLGPGFVIGEERIVTAVSRSFDWRGSGKPRVLLFDNTGRGAPHAMTATQANDGWRIDVKLDDWNAIAIIE